MRECIMSGPTAVPPLAILQSLGITANATITPLGGGWSGSAVFHIATAEPVAGIHDLVLRVVPGESRGPQREAVIHELAGRYGIPAPEIIAIGPIPNGTAMVMPLMPGTALTELLLQATPTDATAWGIACGTMLARIHAIPTAALADLDAPSWLTWMPPSPVVMRVLGPWLDDPVREPRTDRLLHLDYHPANLLGDADTLEISAVLDWTNARIGPPIADLARTRSILRLFAATGVPDSVQSALSAFEAGLQAGWERQHGPVEPAMMRAFDAWALDVQITDLAPKLSMPGSWVSASLLDALRANRDATIAASVANRER